MSLFGGKNNKKKQAEKEKQEQTAELKKFDIPVPTSSVFTSKMRSKSYKMLLESENYDAEDELFHVWREAWFDPAASVWKITEHKTKPNFTEDNADDSIAVQITPLDDCQSLNFFETLQKLADYESQQQSMGFTVVKKPDQRLYFRDCAMREQTVIFDIHGQPHPLSNGEIVTPGDFSQHSIAALEQGKLQSLSHIPVDSNPFDNSNLVVIFQHASSGHFDNLQFTKAIFFKLSKLMQRYLNTMEEYQQDPNPDICFVSNNGSYINYPDDCDELSKRVSSISSLYKKGQSLQKDLYGEDFNKGKRPLYHFMEIADFFTQLLLTHWAQRVEDLSTGNYYLNSVFANILLNKWLSDRANGFYKNIGADT